MKISYKRPKRHSQTRLVGTMKKHLHGQLIKLWQACIREFVIETTRHIAIDTGMSAASLVPLAAKVRLASFLRAQIAGGVKRPARRGYTDMNFQYSPDALKSRAHGERLGRDAYKISFGTPLAPNLSFEFEIVVLQHLLHESVANYKRSHNWESLEKGKKAFIDSWEILLPDYISAEDINRWIVTGVFRSAK